MRICLRFEGRRVACRRCGKVKTERLEWLAENPHFTRRFAFYVGRLCREMTIKRVATLLHLTWDQVKDLEKQYMQVLLAKAPKAGPRAIGIDEVSIRKRHTYRILVSDLDAARSIWFGGTGRKEEDLDQFFAWLGPAQTAQLEIAVMDMWKAFRNSTRTQAPQVRIIFDKFHIMRHLGEALDAVRKSEYRRVAEKDRAFIKGQKYTLLSARANLDLEGRQALRKLLQANRRLHTAYPAQGELRPAVELPPGRQRPALLRELAGPTEVATAPLLRGVRQDDRPPLGWDCCLLPPREQGVPRVC